MHNTVDLHNDAVPSSQNPLQAVAAAAADEKLIKVARRVVRFILSTSTSERTIFSRDKLVKIIHEIGKEEGVTKVPFLKVYPIVNELLYDIYGYELREISPKITRLSDNSSSSSSTATASNVHKEPRQGNNPTTSQRATHFILLNKLPYMPNFSSFKLTHTIKNYQDQILDGEYIGDDMDMPSTNTIDSKLSVDQDLVLRGLLSIILLTILFSKNNILHSELLDSLKTMNVPVDGTDIPILKMNVDVLLKILERREYILKFEQRGETENAIAVYKIGRRAKYEFDLDSLTLMTKELMGLSDEQSVSLKEDLRKVLGDAYQSLGEAK